MKSKTQQQKAAECNKVFDKKDYDKRQDKGSRMVMRQVLKTLEALHIVKKGVVKTKKILLVAADALVEGGKLEIFTPVYLVVVSKKKD